MVKTILATALLAGVAYVASSSPTYAADAPHFRLCTGNSEGSYYAAGQYLKRFSDKVPVDVVATQGSLDNLDRVVRGECDGAFVQGDSMLVYSAKDARAISTVERAGVLYKEYVQLFCNKRSGISDVSDLNAKTTLSVGPEGSGSRTAWNAFILADKNQYSKVPLDDRAGDRQLAAVDDGTEVQCFLSVGSQNMPSLRNTASAHGDHIKIVPTAATDVLGVLKDGRGSPIYSEEMIAGSVYPQLSRPGALYGLKDTPVLGEDALFVGNIAWIKAHPDDYNSVLRAFTTARPSIEKMVTPPTD